MEGLSVCLSVYMLQPRKPYLKVYMKLKSNFIIYLKTVFAVQTISSCNQAESNYEHRMRLRM